MVDELLSAYPHQLSFSEAGMRIMITNHFSPRTRLTMASRMLINEVQANRLTHVCTVVVLYVELCSFTYGKLFQFGKSVRNSKATLKRNKSVVNLNNLEESLPKQSLSINTN